MPGVRRLMRLSEAPSGRPQEDTTEPDYNTSVPRKGRLDHTGRTVHGPKGCGGRPHGDLRCATSGSRAPTRRCQANRRGQYSPSSGGPRERRRRREGRAARIPLHALVPREVPPIPLHISHVLIEVQEERQKFFMRLVTVHQARSDHPRIIEFHGVDVAGEDVPPVLVANGHPCGPLTLHADGDLRGDGGTGEVEDRRRRERGTLGPEGPRALRDHCVSRPASVPAARALGYWRQVTPLATW